MVEEAPTLFTITCQSMKKSKLILYADLSCLYSIDRNMKVGDSAPLAHQDTRKFPDWYKPYTFNYHGEGYLALFFGGMCLFGYSYLSDIAEQKGRRSRKIFSSEHLMTNAQKHRDGFLARKRIAANDADY